MTNIERLTARLNAHKHCRRIYNALLALAPVFRAARTEQQRTKLLEYPKKKGAKEHERYTTNP